MSLKFVNGDMLKVEPVVGRETILAHGVNCKGVMGSGIAKSIKVRFPKVYDQYANLVARAGGRAHELLGRCQLVMVPEYNSMTEHTSIFAVANLFTQVDTGADARYDAVVNSLEKLSTQLLQQVPTDIYLPQIGCGIGGLEWDKMVPIIESFYESIDKSYQCNVFVVEEFIAGVFPE